MPPPIESLPLLQSGALHAPALLRDIFLRATGRISGTASPPLVPPSESLSPPDLVVPPDSNRPAAVVADPPVAALDEILTKAPDSCRCGCSVTPTTASSATPMADKINLLEEVRLMEKFQLLLVDSFESSETDVPPTPSPAADGTLPTPRSGRSVKSLDGLSRPSSISRLRTHCSTQQAAAAGVSEAPLPDAAKAVASIGRTPSYVPDIDKVERVRALYRRLEVGRPMRVFNEAYRMAKEREQLYFKQKVQFRVFCKTEFGQNVFVCGSIPELGRWDVHRAFPLYWTKRDMWESSPIILPRGLEFEYKYLIKQDFGAGESRGHGSQHVSWEEGANRTTRTAPAESPQKAVANSKKLVEVCLLRDTWRDQLPSQRLSLSPALCACRDST